MEIGLIDADLMDHGTRHPNLALMKIAGYHKSIGNNVTLIYNSYNEIELYDKVFISSVFNYTVVPEWIKTLKKVIIGGTGFYEDGGTPLPEYIEHCMPYYELYNEYINYSIENGKDASYFSDYINYSIGFTTRGCFRKCDFCVNKKYNTVQRHSSVEEFVDNDRPMIYLWDDNILAYPKWEQVLDELEEIGKPFQFRQGLDIRLMTDRKAFRLNKVKYHGDFIFAFDHLDDKELIINKIQLWKKYSNKLPKTYVLAAFNSQDANDIADVFERIYILMKYGCLPYIMRFEMYKGSLYEGVYTQIARWCNQPQFYKKMSFREFCERNQYYHSNPNTLCASYKAMVNFEQENPDIARKYFDLRFEDENIYGISYGYGRKYYNKPECSQCRQTGKCWDNITNSELDEMNIISWYYQKEIDLSCLEYKNSECCISVENASNLLCNIIYKCKKELIHKAIAYNDDLTIITKSDCIIPRYKCEYYIDLLLRLFQKNINNKYIIRDFLEGKNGLILKDKKEIIEIFRLLTLMDFIILNKNNINGEIRLSAFGKAFMRLRNKEQQIIFNKNIFRLPVVQYYLINNEHMFKEKLINLGVKNLEIIYEYMQELCNKLMGVQMVV